LKKRGLNRSKNWHLNPLDPNVWSFQKDPTALRRVGELYAQYFLALRGAIVHIPDKNAPYDLLVSSKEIGDYQRIQVKTSSHKMNGGYVFSLIRSRSNSKGVKKREYSVDECDYFFLLDIENNAWMIPFDKIKTRKINPSIKYANFKLHE
jgi:hypothetical protein